MARALVACLGFVLHESGHPRNGPGQDAGGETGQAQRIQTNDQEIKTAIKYNKQRNFTTFLLRAAVPESWHFICGYRSVLIFRGWATETHAADICRFTQQIQVPDNPCENHARIHAEIHAGIRAGIHVGVGRVTIAR